ncbi:MAG: Rieske (2Fe-2S) protein [Bacteroidota bacterium]|nr:Rieske (2Fe-2S) protein [Bacteroidota bacterium]
MERKEFLKICGGTCLGLIGLSAALQSCNTSYYAQGTVTNNKIQISKKDFINVHKEKTSIRKYVLVKPANFDFPIVVYRRNETTFTALLLRCTHQSNELNVNGDILTCTAHGSEFSNTGEVIQGPAEQKLVSYPVSTDENNIYIQLS